MNKNYSLSHDKNIPKIVRGRLYTGKNLKCIYPTNVRIVGYYIYFYRSSLFSLDFCPTIICDNIWISWQSKNIKLLKYIWYECFQNGRFYWHRMDAYYSCSKHRRLYTILFWTTVIIYTSEKRDYTRRTSVLLCKFIILFGFLSIDNGFNCLSRNNHNSPISK